MNADPYRTPVDVRGRKLSGLTFSRLVVRLPNNEIGVEGDHLRVRFIEELRKFGYPALGAESLVFDRDESDDARFVLGGTVYELACRPIGYPEAGLRRCGISVQWELLDREKDSVAYRVVSRHASTAVAPQQIADELVWGAFYSLLARPRFVEALAERQADGPGTTFTRAKFRRCPAQDLAMPGSADEVMRSVVVVRSGQRLGSGTMISPDGLVLTAAHVLTPGAKVELQHRDGTTLAARVIRMQASSDVALLRAVSSSVHSCVALRESPPSVGEDLFAIGSPLGQMLSFSLTRGVVSGMRTLNGVSLVQTDASINRGNSGGPLLDSLGRLVAVVSWKAAGAGIEGIAFGIPTDTALDRLSLTADESETDALLDQAAHQSASASAVSPDDRPDPVIPLEPPRLPEPAGVTIPSDKPRGPKTPLARSLTIAGIVGTGVGAAGVATTYLLYSGGKDEMARDEFDRLRLANDASWVLVAAGAGVFIAGELLPRQQLESIPAQKPSSKRQRSRSATIPFASVGFGSVQFGVRY